MANPAFSNPRLSPDQADLLAATFRPSWDLDDAPSPDATLTDADVSRLQNGATMALVNGRHASEPRIPPAAQHVSEPESSVIIDRSITADDLANRAPAPALAATMPLQQAPAAFPSAPPPPVAAPALASTLPLQQQPAVARPAPIAPPVRAVAPQRAALPVDDDVAPPKSKTGLIVGIVAAAVAAVVVIGVVVAKSGGDEKTAPTATATAAKTDDKPSIPPPPALTDMPASKPTAAPSATAPATTAKPDVPAKPDAPAKPDKPKPVAAAPNNDTPPAPKPPKPPAAPRPAVPVKDVPF